MKTQTTEQAYRAGVYSDGAVCLNAFTSKFVKLTPYNDAEVSRLKRQHIKATTVAAGIIPKAEHDNEQNTAPQFEVNNIITA